ncbi:hypothetical protein H5410_017167 [Solanum commersonii]|uniref:Uncharacterized protein n=1 Tax=Solanum commersonii TaxID=4109 RepID=A0A9J5ZZR8_SOLCO|nr:hypothetical protein H5410_017167 [Solanum commersonii]
MKRRTTKELHWNKDSIDQDVTYNFTSNVTVVEGKGIYHVVIKFRGLDADINLNDSDDHHDLKQGKGSNSSLEKAHSAITF